MARLRVLFVTLVVILTAAPVRAQTGGAVTGSVTDPTDRAVVAAEVTAEREGHGLVRRTMTGATGLYRLVDLLPGRYTITVTAPGFEPARRTGVLVRVDSSLDLDLRLSLHGYAQQVDVVASTAVLERGRTDLGTIVERERLVALPMNRRDFLQLALLAPGTAPPVEGSELASRGAFAMHVNGGREEFNSFQLDGVDNTDPYVSRYVVQPPVDAIEEFRVVTNGYSAEYGRSAAGQVNVITRAGSDQVHGFFYEYFRDDALDARHVFDEGGRAALRRDQLGAGLGGPIVRGRLFGFATLDHLRSRRGLSRLAVVPSDAARQGDLSSLAATVMDPFTRQPFAGNVIPSERISPVAREVLKAFPLPNRAGAFNYLGEPTEREDQWQGHVRLDWTASASDRVTGRVSRGVASIDEPYAEEAGTLPGFGDEVEDRALNAMVEHQRTLGHRAVHTLRAGFSRLGRDLLPENHDVDVGAAWGVDWLDVPARARGYPSVSVAGVGRIGDSTGLPIIRRADTFQLIETVAIDRGAHLLRLGGEVRHSRLDATLDVLARGSLSFSGAFTGSGLGDLLLGLPSFALQASSDHPVRLRSTAVSLFAQDEWRLTSRATLNLGLRYEFVAPPEDPEPGLMTFDAERGTLVPLGTGRIPAAGVRSDRDNIAPRLGMAWRLDADTVLHAAYGLFYDSGMFTVYSAQAFNPPAFTLRMFFPTSTQLLTLDRPFPATGGVVPPAALNVLNPDLVTSLMHHWNVGVERAVGGWGTARLGYAGSRGLHLVQARDINQPEPGPGAVQARRPHPEYGAIFFVDSRGTSAYHALEASVNRRWSGRWSMLASYTLSRSMDENSAFLDTRPDANFPQNSRDLAAEWGPSSFDVRHRATLAFSAALPDRWVWSRHTRVGALVSLHSGPPFTPALRFDNSNTGNNGGTTGSDRPNLVGDPASGSPGPDRWFNTAAFAVPERYTFGNAGRNSLRGPGYASVDVSVARTLTWGGHARLVLEVQGFNLLNRANYDLPMRYVDEPATFGRIVSARAPRQVQLAARVEF